MKIARSGGLRLLAKLGSNLPYPLGLLLHNKSGTVLQCQSRSGFIVDSIIHKNKVGLRFLPTIVKMNVRHQRPPRSRTVTGSPRVIYVLISVESNIYRKGCLWRPSAISCEQRFSRYWIPTICRRSKGTTVTLSPPISHLVTTECLHSMSTVQ